MKVRRAQERGLTETDWLISRHSFSFGEYFDPAYMGFRSLRVINDDWVAPGRGFGMHGHRDMEIITLVLEGELEHQDSLGNCEVLRPGEVQVMSAGKGIQHSERNPSKTVRAHFLQIWIEPRAKGIESRYAQKSFPLGECRNSWCRLAGHSDFDDQAFEIYQDIEVFYGTVTEDERLTCLVNPKGAAWVHVIAGDVRFGAVALKSGDAVVVESEGAFEIIGAAQRSELLLFSF